MKNWFNTNHILIAPTIFILVTFFIRIATEQPNSFGLWWKELASLILMATTFILPSFLPKNWSNLKVFIRIFALIMLGTTFNGVFIDRFIINASGVFLTALFSLLFSSFATLLVYLNKLEQKKKQTKHN